MLIYEAVKIKRAHRDVFFHSRILWQFKGKKNRVLIFFCVYIFVQHVCINFTLRNVLNRIIQQPILYYWDKQISMLRYITYKFYKLQTILFGPYHTYISFVYPFGDTDRWIEITKHHNCNHNYHTHLQIDCPCAVSTYAPPDQLKNIGNTDI